MSIASSAPPWVRETAERLAGIAVVVWGAATLSFAALQLMPGDTVDALLGPNVAATPELRQEIVGALQLDRPLGERYLSFLGRLAVGDFGQSYRLGRPVSDVLAESLWPTVQLAVAALVFTTFLALALALSWALGGRGTRGVIALAELIGSSLPSYWLGIVAIGLFSFRLRWLPAAGSGTVDAVILPAIALALPIGCVMARVVQDSFARSAAAPFTLTVRARGVSRLGVTLRHHLRHAAASVLTLGGWTLASFLGGAVIIEVVFARSGFGRTLVDAVSTRDMPVVTSITVLCALLFGALNWAIDLVNRRIDPRLR
ncbi:ABC transporter permease [Mycobacteroides saopaulense]|uniref:ABC transporter permease n=1 Tax=Mycobacteroides saopaulense TaxID=1578165 RepID=UPI0012FFCFFE|nr:ABC transporter permease [Mycobacteroides saopaulense]